MHFFIDESGFDDESNILLVGLVIIDNPDITRDSINALKEDILHDPFLGEIPTIGELKSIGFHYSGDHFEVKNKFIDLISCLIFLSYICFVPKNELNKSDFKSLYKDLIRKILFDRIRDFKDTKLHICFEHNYLKKQIMSDIISNIIDDINKKDKNIITLTPTITYSGKEEACLSLVDYVCGIFRAHYENIGKKDNVERRNFDRVRKKIRVIHNLFTDVFYTRHNPFP